MKRCDCGKLGTWMYIPFGWVVCDECIDNHRGCSCNVRHVDQEAPPNTNMNGWKWLIENETWTPLDQNGKEYPCIEFDYQEDGYEDDICGIDVIERLFGKQTLGE